MPFFVLAVVYLLTAGALLRAGCNGIGGADGTGEGLLAAAVGLGGLLSVGAAGIFGALARRARRMTGPVYRKWLLALAPGVAPFVFYACIRLSR